MAAQLPWPRAAAAAGSGQRGALLRECPLSS